MDCIICCESFNKSTRTKIICNTCDNDSGNACQSCCKKFILDSSTKEKCMICNTEWNYEFMYDNFTHVFVKNELKNHNTKLLLEKQIAKLPETQEYANKFKLMNGLHYQKNLLIEENKKLNDLIKKNKQKIDIILVTIGDVYTDIHDGEKNSVVSVEKYNCKCPIGDCLGFLNSSYECGLCDNVICKLCMEIKTLNDDNIHICDDDKKKTIALIKKDTKGCPKCGEMIHKIDGCDQMWCITCHTPFSWRTGIIEVGNVHNPEYYRWMREGGIEIPRDAGVVVRNQCGDFLPDYQNFLMKLRMIFPQKQSYETLRRTDSYEVIILSNMHRLIIHMINESRYLGQRLNSSDLHEKNFRKDYLLNVIDKNKFEKSLMKLHRGNEIDVQYENVWKLISAVLYEYIGLIYEFEITNSNIKELQNKTINIVKSSKQVIKCSNKSFKRIGQIYGVVYPGLRQDWRDVGNYAEHLKRIERENVD